MFIGEGMKVCTFPAFNERRSENERERGQRERNKEGVEQG